LEDRLVPAESMAAVATIARLIDLELSDEQIKHIAPRIQHYLKRVSDIDLAAIRDVEPAIVFHADAD